MALQQLYYTSCERGLNPYAGYQFNAVSADVSAETMRKVEALASYEPPNSLMFSDAPEDLARCPVNLCFVPGETAVAACVRYVGRDHTNRFGNYFAHALSGDDLVADRSPLPIELWGSAGWTDRQAPDNRLPDLTGAPPPGPLTPEGVERFLRAHPHGDRLPGLAAASIAAHQEGRSVIVVDATTDDIAHWFAAVCYLLPPWFGRSLSFATYLSNPGRGRLHLIGTLPEIRLEFGRDNQDVFQVFDFQGAKFADVLIPPLIRLLSRVGVASAPALWSWTEDYATGRERDLEGWYPPAAIAAASGGTPLATDEVEAVIGWLDTTGHLDPPILAGTVRDVYRQRGLSSAQLAILSRAAHASQDTALIEQIQGDNAEAEMAAYMAGGTAPATPVPLTNPVIRQRATARWHELLRTADSEPAVRLLHWASHARLSPEPGVVLAKCTEISRDLLGRTVISPISEDLRRRLPEVAREWPEFRQGMVAALARLLDEHPHYFPHVLSGLPNALVTQADLVGQPALQENFLIAGAEHDHGHETSYLTRILELRDPRVLDEKLLRALWPVGRWTASQARQVNEALPAGLTIESSASVWFDNAVTASADGKDLLANAVELCKEVWHRQDLLGLSQSARNCVSTVLELTGLLAGPTSSRQFLTVVEQNSPLRWGLVESMLRQHLPRALVSNLAEPTDMVRLLHRMDYFTSLEYIRRAETAVTEITPMTFSHVVALAAAANSPLSIDQRAQVDKILIAITKRWSANDLARLAGSSESFNPVLAKQLAEIADEKRQTMGRKAIRALPKLIGGRGKTKKAEAAGPGTGGEGRERPGGEPAGERNPEPPAKS